MTSKKPYSFAWILPFSDKKQGGYKTLLSSPDSLERARLEFEHNRTTGTSESKWHCDKGKGNCSDCKHVVSFLTALKKRLGPSQADEQPAKRVKTTEQPAYVEGRQAQTLVTSNDGQRTMIVTKEVTMHKPVLSIDQ